MEMVKESTRPVAIVTGASSGIGLHTSIALAQSGHRVFATMRNLGKRAELDRTAASAGIDLTVLQLDVCDAKSIEAAAREVEAQAGRVDVLVNNAGLGIIGYFEDQTVDEIREQVETNFMGPVTLMKAVLPGMIARRRGRIINVTSASGLVPSPGVPAYTGAKWAMEGFSESAHIELLPHGIQVVLVEPGMHKTEIFTSNLRKAAAVTNPDTPQGARIEHLTKWLLKTLERNGGDPRFVADRIVVAATVRRPHRRYICGKDAHMAAMMRSILPQRVYEWAMRKQLDTMTAAPS